MNNILTVIQREYAVRVKKKSFIIMTILAPLFLILIGSAPFLLAGFGSDKQVVAVIDSTGEYLPLLKSTEDYTFVKADKSLKEYASMSEKERKVTAVLDITGDLIKNPSAISIFSYKQIPDGVETYISKTLEEHIYKQKMEAYNIPNLKEIMDDLNVKLDVSTYKWDDKGDVSVTSKDIAKFLGLGFTFICYMFIFMYGQMVFSSVLEEKKNRIMEVIISSLKPFHFMVGKIVGIMLVGLTQLIIWAVLITGAYFALQIAMLGNIYSSGALQSINPADISGGMASGMSLEDVSSIKNIFMAISGLNIGEILSLFILYFIGGYLFFASIFASLGSALNSEEDATQVMVPLTVIQIFSIYAAMGSLSNPEGSLAFWCSMIPFTSPVVMMVRLPYEVPLWQEILSVVLLYASFLCSAWIGAKIYRIGVLMYGKKPSFKEIWRWIRYY